MILGRASGNNRTTVSMPRGVPGIGASFVVKLISPPIDDGIDRVVGGSMKLGRGISSSSQDPLSCVCGS